MDNKKDPQIHEIGKPKALFLKDLTILFTLAGIAFIIGIVFNWTFFTYKKLPELLAVERLVSFRQGVEYGYQQAMQEQEEFDKIIIEYYASKIMEYNNNIDRATVYGEVEYLYQKTKETRIPIQFTIGIIIKESRGNPYARSNADALGLCQIRWIIWGEALKSAGIMVERRDCFDYRKSIDGMYLILNDCIKQAEKSGKFDWITVFEIYNKGYSGAKNNDFSCTHYARGVLSIL